MAEDPRDKELAALRKLVETAAEMLRCGGASVLVRIEQELEYRMQDAITIGSAKAHARAIITALDSWPQRREEIRKHAEIILNGVDP